MQAAIREKFVSTGLTAGPGEASKEGVDVQKQKSDEQVTAEKIKKAEAAKAAIAQAKANVAARTAASGAAPSSAPTSTSGAATGSSVVSATTPAQPKVKKASRVVTLMKMRKSAQGEDKIPLSSRVYVYIRSPVFPNLDDKAVYVDK
ncbi:hypothetical protein BGX26_003741 [Mortierella sp. AD094]|nr:hypothetical protein BGX26_003741 [Mortierella sp. AD094]